MDAFNRLSFGITFMQIILNNWVSSLIRTNDVFQIKFSMGINV